MNVGELFIKLGVKGDGSAKKALKGTYDGLGEIRSMSLEAKAAIIGVIYGLQRMMSSSLKGGQDLANFAAFTGMSTQALQKYQYAAKLVGMSNEEMTGSFTALQKGIASLDLSGDGLESLGGISQFLARAGESLDVQRFKTDIPYAIQMLQKFKQLDSSMFGGQQNPEGFKNLLLSKMGVSDSMISAFGRNAFNEKTLNSAPIKSEGQIKSLANMDAQWTKIMTKIDRLIDNLIVTFGPDVMKEISKLIDIMYEVATMLLKFLKEQKPVETMKKGYESIASGKLFKAMSDAGASETMRAFNKVFGIDKSLDKLGNALSPSSFFDTVKDQEMKKAKALMDLVTPSSGQKKVPDEGTIIEEQVNNNESNFYFDIKSMDPKETAKEIKQVVNTLNLIPTRSYGA